MLMNLASLILGIFVWFGFFLLLLGPVQVAQLTEMAEIARKTLSFTKLKAARRTDASGEIPFQTVL